MWTIGRAAFFTLAIIAGVSYCGAWWFLYPCNVHESAFGRELGEGVGRELREGAAKSRPRSTLVRGEQPCPEAPVGLQISSGGSLMEVDRHQAKPQPSAEFEDPWSKEMVAKALKQWVARDTALKKGDTAYFGKETACTGIDWLQKGGFLAAWHKRERVEALKAIQANPAAATSKTCPKPADVLTRLKDEAEAASGEIEEGVTLLHEHLAKQEPQNQIKLNNPHAVWHMAETDHEIRTLLGKPALPLTPEFVVKHWVPVVDQLETELKAAGCDHAQCANRIHFWLMEDQLENVRKSLLKPV